MIIDHQVPDRLQHKLTKIELDDQIQKAKASLLNDIKRSVYIYRVDCGGCNGCEIEIYSTITPVFDAERFGIKNTASPRHADIVVFTGAMTRSTRMPALRAYQGAPDPKLVVSYGACGCTGGVFHDNYSVWGGTDKLFPVDVYIPGCPPSPAQTIYGFAIALGLLGQKLHHTDIVEAPGEQAPLRFADIPYKARVAIERKAREMTGYLSATPLVNEFLETLEQGGSDVSADLSALILRQSDPRRAEILSELHQELLSMVVAQGSDTGFGQSATAAAVPSASTGA